MERELEQSPFVVDGMRAAEPTAGESMDAVLRDGTQRAIGQQEITDATETLKKYKAGKANLEHRLVTDEQWYKMRHWELMGKEPAAGSPQPSSAWLFNSILNKHADAMDNIPQSIVLPRERSDEELAKRLSDVLPVIFEENGFEETYSDGWWAKLKHGTAAYAQTWDNTKLNGLGDIAINDIDLLKLFWEPGITDIQDSRNLFIVDLVDKDLLHERYPDFDPATGGQTIDVTQYIYDDSVDVTDKAVVVDWYYKKQLDTGRTIVHLCKFVGDTLLFASENEEEYRNNGIYDHGQYPVVLDVLYPEEGTPVGFGLVAICKDPQIYIDKLSANILERSMQDTKRRFFKGANTNINAQQMLDWNQPFIDVDGSMDEMHLRELIGQPLSPVYLEVMNSKIEEMKDTSGNRDVNTGGAGSGVTAAAAIAALQEAGNKGSRDMISGSYRCHNRITDQCIELIRQFYDTPRTFRITGDMPGGYEFVDIDNSQMVDQLTGEIDGEQTWRRPCFDLKIKAQKKNPFSRMEQNERAKELYQMGFFSPQRAQESMIALEMMDFEGIDKVRDQVREGMTLQNMVAQLSQEKAMLQQALAVANGLDPAMMGQEEQPAGQSAPSGSPEAPKGNRQTQEIMQSRQPQTPYMQSLQERSKPNVEGA